jgi:hypothetical protein
MKTTEDCMKKIFDYMYERVGGESNHDIKTYRNRSPVITQEVFFREIVWAIWVAGKSRVSAEVFLNRALQKGFVYDYKDIACWSEDRQTKFLESLHGWTKKRGLPRQRPVPGGAIGRWGSIFFIARELAKYKTEKEFQEKFFAGKRNTMLLDEVDISRLVSMNIPYLKDVTVHFLVRNMGAEAIKEDRWVKAFLGHCGLTRYELEKLLRSVGIPLGLFDAVLWCYCEMFVGQTQLLEQHFKTKSL